MNRIGQKDVVESHDRIAAVCSVRSWKLWSRPPASILLILTLDLIALGVVGASLITTPTTRAMAMMLGLIMLAAVAQGEASRRIERARRVISGSVHINMMSVWVFAAVLTLPIGWVGVVTALTACHVVLRSYDVARSRAHRQVMNAAAMVLAAWGARAVLDAAHVPPMAEGSQHLLVAGTILALIAAGVVFFVADAVIIAATLILDHPLPAGTRRPIRDLVGSVDDNTLELATICLGGLAGLVLINQPIALLLLFLPMFVLHRSVLVKQLEVLAATDQKTGLLNSVAWNDAAQRALDRARRLRSSLAVLMVDLDHFKRVNDVYGHLAGDTVLKVVAKAITDGVRDYDSVGRFGGEEFVVLLPGIDRSDAVAIAERVRHAITQLTVPIPAEDQDVFLSGLSVSIGVASYPGAGVGIDHIVRAADAALYRAKASGRNRVELDPSIEARR
ncbi:MAG TPA: GGDEF domain-containing protein [Pseudonocardiaceae bacterium]|nr:GGDEF domain-containing protein [Pseudonocardiaceae bacterium]